MKKTIITIIVLIIIGVVIYYVSSMGSNNAPSTVSSSQNSNPSPAPSPTPVPTPTPISITVTPAKASVSINNFSFSPGTLSIKKGTKVTWTNNDSVPHTVTSDSGSLLNSPTLSPGQSFSFTFTSVGSVGYHCAIHPSMKGSIVVGN